jgi:hypothetical protein
MRQSLPPTSIIIYNESELFCPPLETFSNRTIFLSFSINSNPTKKSGINRDAERRTMQPNMTTFIFRNRGPEASCMKAGKDMP